MSIVHTAKYRQKYQESNLEYADLYSDHTHLKSKNSIKIQLGNSFMLPPSFKEQFILAKSQFVYDVVAPRLRPLQEKWRPRWRRIVFAKPLYQRCSDVVLRTLVQQQQTDVESTLVYGWLYDVNLWSILQVVSALNYGWRDWQPNLNVVSTLKE
jgi:hypothetical protein